MSRRQVRRTTARTARAVNKGRPGEDGCLQHWWPSANGGAEQTQALDIMAFLQLRAQWSIGVSRRPWATARACDQRTPALRSTYTFTRPGRCRRWLLVKADSCSMVPAAAPATTNDSTSENASEDEDDSTVHAAAHWAGAAGKVRQAGAICAPVATSAGCANERRWR